MCLNDERANNIAQRAQRRHFRRVLKQPDFELVARFDSLRFSGWIFVCSSAALVAYVLPTMISAWRDIRTDILPVEHLLASLMIYGLVFGFQACFCGALAWLGIALVSANGLRHARFNATGIDAQFRDGRRVRKPWCSVTRIGVSGIWPAIHFDDGARLTLCGLCSRTLNLLRAVQCPTGFRERTVVVRESRATAIRMLVLVVLFSMGAAVVTACLRRVDPTLPSPYIAAATMLSVGALLSTLCLVPCVSNRRGCARRLQMWERRNRRPLTLAQFVR